MKTKLSSFFIFLSAFVFSQTQFSGTVLSEDGYTLNHVKIYNTSTHSRVILAKEDGSFSILAKIGDNIAFIRDGYERKNIVLGNNESLIVSLKASSRIIEEVNIFKTTGDLKKDGRQFKNNNELDGVKDALGVPGAPEKPREEAPKLNPSSVLSVSKMAKIISGDARRMKSLYKYEDEMEDLNWLKQNINIGKYILDGLEEDEIESFFVFALGAYELSPLIKKNSTPQIELKLDQAVKDYLKNKQKLESSKTE